MGEFSSGFPGYTATVPRDCTLRMRLTAALRHKAARGELRQHLPVGLDYDDDSQVVLSADEAVRAAIGQVHALFGRLGSARQVMMTLREQGLRLPRRKAGAVHGHSR